MKDKDDKLVFEENDRQQVTMKLRTDLLERIHDIKIRTIYSRDDIVDKLLEFALDRVEFK